MFVISLKEQSFWINVCLKESSILIRLEVSKQLEKVDQIMYQNHF